ncbi:MAG: transcription termination/antitermination protein NusG [Mycoplasma sp.]
MKQNQQDLYQWFIITVVGGKEDSIIQTIKEKLLNFSYEEYVRDIKVFKTQKVTEQTFSKTDPSLPKNLKNTKTITWKTLPNGEYLKTTTKIVNKFPGYVFINMLMDPQVWYCIRNTNGVMGFVGSTGKGALPIPISIAEYENVANEKPVQTIETTTEEKPSATVEAKPTYVAPCKVGNTVIITEGAFNGEKGTVKAIDEVKGSAMVQIQVFGRETNIDIPFNQLKLEE